ncbi:MAG: CDP-alcohol phosphatidyltransferase family protein [Marivivens sp.]|nr:CDP-alcohol phosphatidyltransferase family protein [Marivivens sp.]
MLDAKARRIIDPPLNRLGALLARAGVSADAVTLVGLSLGIFAAICIAVGSFGWAILLIVLNRLADGLDGAIARATRRTGFGGYLDITSDFLFYGAIPLGFALYEPSTNAVAAAFLLLSFYVNGASFLGYAILAEKSGMKTRAQGVKSLYYSDGLLEGTETIAFFLLICLFPAAFVWFGAVFAALCFATAALRLYAAKQVFVAVDPAE